MFGYLTVDRGELKGRELDTYRAYYCGVCRDIRDASGEAARFTLTYDLTFLAILLTSLYEEDHTETDVRCVLRPVRGTKVIRNSCTAYAADMNLLLAYHDLEDNWIDDRNAPSYAASRVLRKAYLRKASQYPRQTRAIRHYLKALHDTEASDDPHMEAAAIQTGELMAEIYQYRDDEWTDLMRETGFYIGKFIYLMDAWDDLEKDRKKHAYNPFLHVPPEMDTEETAVRLMTMQASAAARAFEELPLLQDVDILRNILYSGIWVRYRAKKKSGKDDSEKDKENNK